MVRLLSFLALFVATAAFADAPVIWNGTSVKWLPSGFQTAGVIINSSAGVSTILAPGSSGNILVSNGSQWTSAANTAALSVGALDAQAANATGLALVSNVLSTQSADATHPGVVNNTTQTLSGAKTFSSTVTAPRFFGNGGDGTTPSFYVDTGGGSSGFYFGANGTTFLYNTAEVASFVSSVWKFNVPIQANYVGSAGSPAFFLDNSPNSGFWQIGANNWGWSASSAKVLDMSTTGLGITGALNVSGTTTLATSLTGVTRADSGVISAAELSGDVTTSGSNVTTLKNTGAGAGSCTNCSVTFDAQGRETTYSSGTAPVTTMGAFGSTPNANGASISGNTLTLQPADGTNPGGISTTTQTFAGAKTINIAKASNLTSNGFVRTSGGDGTLGVQTDPCTVAEGCTGLATLTAHAVYVGNGTSAPTAIAVPASGTIFQGVAASDPTWTATPTLGVTGATTGTLAMAGATSGTVTIQPQAAAGTFNFNLPTSAGTAGQPLLSGGGGGAAQTYGTLGVSGGGTGLATLTAHAIYAGNGTSAPTALSVGATGSILQGSSGADPAFSSTPTLGIAGTTAGTLALSGVTSGVVTVATADAAGTWTFKLPTSGGTNNYFLKTDGSGNSSWAAVSATAPTDLIIMKQSNSNGSTNTSIRRFVTTTVNTGSAITLAQSSTAGDSFTINNDGIYCITYSDAFNVAGGSQYGITKNQATLTGTIDGSLDSTLVSSYTHNSGDNDTTTWCGDLVNTDVIRAATGSTANSGSPSFARFVIKRML